ncbi:MAG: SIR2 family protein [Chloroflexi bacterium]|nr:SIR2 family protein [Chloroflexota bacterium]
MAYDWLSDPDDERHIAALRDRVGKDAARVLIFLGAGLSFGVGRYLGRASFERPQPYDDDRFPSWPDLIERMKRRVLADTEDPHEATAVESFFGHNDYLDCAQLFRATVGRNEYHAFLESQFGTSAEDEERLTASHEALVRLPVRELFTTNYDQLIELAFASRGETLVVSTSSDEFKRHHPDRPEHHLIKVHGSIETLDRIVLTREDYAESRRARAEMFEHLMEEVRYSSFLFVGFSLTDPNFNIIRDDARVVMGENMPSSYLVQQRPNPVMERYLASLQVETIALESWNWMPALLDAINPASG